MRAGLSVLLLALGCGLAETPPRLAPLPAPVPAAVAVAPPIVSAGLVATAEETPLPPEPAPPEIVPPNPVPSGPRLFAVKGTNSILSIPDKKAGRYLGYIRVGESVALRRTETVSARDCSGGYFAIEPRGYVCNDSHVSLAPSAEVLNATAATAPREGPYPYRYAVSNGAPMYNRIPKRTEITRFERVFGPAGQYEPLPPFLAAHEDLATDDPIVATDPLPPFLEGGHMIRPGRFGLVRQKIPRGSMLSYTKSFLADGRTYLLSVDLTVVPADRVRPFKPSAFRGVWLDPDTAVPLAWFRKSSRMKWRKLGSGAMESLGVMFPVRSYARLTGRTFEVSGVKYWETKEREGAEIVWVADADATVIEPRAKLPFGVRDDQKWVHVRITQGTLVAYEGLKPVYATLISPGAGGVPVKGIDPVKASTTPTGTFYVTFKDRAATMSPELGENRSFWIADVPHTQYFNAPFALHAAYWHERFGEPTSAGCVNLSPIDAEILFRWTDPPVPPGWQGAVGAGAPDNGATTAVVISR